jgi:Ion channel
VRRSLSVPREALRRLLFQRCFYLFALLLALIAIAPFIEASTRGSSIYLFAIIAREQVGGFAVRGEIVPLEFMDVLYYSFSMLTTTGLGDIVPVTRIARITSMMEAIVSQLFLAILIAKLVGVYPPREREATSH